MLFCIAFFNAALYTIYVAFNFLCKDEWRQFNQIIIPLIEENASWSTQVCMAGHTNVGEEKPYRKLYELFKKLPLPASYLDKEYSSRYARYFYTEDEIAAFRKHWA